MASSIEIQADTLRKAFEAKGVQLDTMLKRGLEEASILVESKAVVNAPVDTGLLQKSINHRVTGNTGQIGTQVEYAAFQEFGTVKMKPQPFLIPALNSAKAGIKLILAKWIGSKL